MYSGDETVVQSLSLKNEGKKATLTVRGAEPPAHGVNELTILLSNGMEEKPVRWNVGRLVLSLPADKTTNPLLAFSPLPEIQHTFQREAKIVAFPFAVVGVAAVFAPWVLLLGLVSLKCRMLGLVLLSWCAERLLYSQLTFLRDELTKQIGNLSSSLRKRTPPTSVYAFLACIVGLESLIIGYWVKWKLYQFLPPFLVLSGIAAYVGAVAMRQSRVQRIKTGGK